MRAWSRFADGFRVPIEGWRLIKASPSLLVWAVLPLIVQALLVVLGWAYGFGHVSGLLSGLIGGWLSPESFWYGVLYYPALLMATIAMVIIWTYVVFAVATVLAGPFLSALAEEGLRLLKYPLPHASGWRSRLALFGRGIRAGVLKGFLFGLLGIMIFIGQFIPVLNLVVAYFALLLLAFDCLDYNFEAMDVSFRGRLSRAAEFLPELMGLGVCLALTMLLPGLTVLLLPFSVAGMSRLIARRQHAES